MASKVQFQSFRKALTALTLLSGKSRIGIKSAKMCLSRLQPARRGEAEGAVGRDRAAYIGTKWK